MSSESGDECALHPVPQLDCLVEGCTHNPSAIRRELDLQYTQKHGEHLKTIGMHLELVEPPKHLAQTLHYSSFQTA